MTSLPAGEGARRCALAAAVAEEAGRLVLSFYEGAAPSAALSASATSKSTRTDLVTAADTASEELIVSRLLAAHPDDGLLGEEGAARTGESGYRWVIDPLDGTINFFYGFPSFGVSIGCELDGETVAGVVHDPLRHETFSAVRGEGAFLNGRAVRISDDSPPLAEALVSTGFGYDAERRRAQARLLVNVLPNVRDIRRAGAAAVDLCWVAAGRLDALYEAGLAPWDLAAGALVVTEAGGRLTLLDGLIEGATTVVAGSRRVHDELLELLQDA